MLRCSTVVASVGLLAGSAHAQFFEGFDGSLENPWDTFPFPSTNQDDPPFFFFAGFPSGTFEPIAGADVFRMTNVFTPLSYVGMSPALYVMDGSEGIIEARINTMGDEFIPEDGVFNMRVLSPGGESLTWGLFADVNAGTRRVYRESDIQGTNGTLPGFTYSPLTWYRLRLDNTGPTLVGQVLSDAGQLLLEHDFGHALGDLQVSGPGLALAIVQHGFTQPQTVHTDISIDYVRVVAGCPADFAEPIGVLDLNDVGAFVAAFTAQDPAADLNNDGVIDLQDIGLFVASFTAGCP